MSFAILLIILIPVYFIFLMFRSFVRTHDKKNKIEEIIIDKTFDLKLIENEINQAFDLVKKIDKHNSFLDVNEKETILNFFSKLEIPKNYKDYKKEIDTKFFEKINFLFVFKNDLDFFLEEYNDIFFNKEKKRFKDFFAKIESYPLSDEQKLAVVTDEVNTLVVAGAGAGKTSTIIAKTAYLLLKKICKPENILILAFNKDASIEIKNRISSTAQSNTDILTQSTSDIEVKTFHSFGYSVFEKAGIKKPNLSSLSSSPLDFNSFIKYQIEKLLIDKDFKEILTEYFISYLQPYQSVFDFKVLGDYYKYLKSEKITITLKGETVKSYEECEIANFLYLNQINYEYEKPFEIDTATPKFRQYFPDFYLSDYNVYIEHLALNKKGEAPSFFYNYLESLEWKRQQHKEYKTNLIETYSHEKTDGILINNLKKKLLKFGIKPKPLNEKNILQKLNEKGKISDFSKLLITFLNHFKSNEYKISQIRTIAKNKLDNQRYLAFLKIFEKIFIEYEKLLKENKEIDFIDMLLKAKQIISKNNFLSLSHVIVDEYQDISTARFKLLKSIFEKNKKLKFFCVGDDWQSIYRFSGSTINLMTQFKNYFGYTKIINLTNTFRLNQSIADLSTTFVTENSNQIKKRISSQTKSKQNSVSIFISKNDFFGLKKAIKEIIKNNKKDNKILVLGRYKHTINNRKLKKLSEEFPQVTIDFKTLHSSKGLESDNVIILDLNRGTLGFPTEMTDDPILELVMTEEDNYPYAEERRLFYVGLTRSKNNVYLITSPHNQSAFIRELISNEKFNVDIHDEDGVGNIDCKKCKTGWMSKRESAYGPFYGCSNYPYCYETIAVCEECQKGVYITNEFSNICSNTLCQHEPPTCETCWSVLKNRNILDGKYGQFYKCFECGDTQDL